MLLKKLALTLVLGISGISSALAGIEDWNGVFTVQDSDGRLQTVTHTPMKVQFMFFSAGVCLHFGKGSKINGIEFKEEVNFCTNSDIPSFTNEVQKLGVIVDKSVTAGSTYPS
jgi:hypothetical protein